MIVEDVDEFSKFDTGRGAGDIFQYVNRNDLENFLVSVYSFLFEEFTERVEMREDDPTKIQHTQISLMQYLCTKVHQQHFGHHHQLYTYFLERNVKYFNFGMGAGYLEY